MLIRIEFKCKRVLRILHMKMTSFHEVTKCAFKWCEAHDIHKYALFFLFSTYILTAYQPLWQGWYDTYVLPYLAQFVPSVLSLLIALCLVIGYAVDIVRKIKNRYYFSKKIAAISLVAFITILRYRFDDRYQYVSFLNFITYVDVVLLVFAAYIIAFLLSRTHQRKQATNPTTKAKLTHDAPITSVDEDVLNYKAEAEKIALEINNLDLSKSWSLALTAPWGCGKTSFMNFVVDELKKDDIFDVLAFNPRNCCSCQTIQEEFFSLFACLLAKYDCRCNRVIYDYMESLQLVDNRGVIERWLNHRKSKDRISLKNDIALVLSKLDKKILVLVDDFDRLSKEEIMEVLKLIDTNAAFTKMVFLTAFDKDKVDKVLGRQYRTKEASFVDKFFNMEVALPLRPFPYISDYFKKLLLEKLQANEEEKAEISNFFRRDDLIRNYITNLRDVKRYVNQVVIDYENVRGEVFLRTFLLLQLIKYKHPARFIEIHNFKYTETTKIVGNPSIIYLKNDISSSLEIMPVLKNLFPSLNDCFTSSYRHIYDIRSFEYYFANQIYVVLKIRDILKLFSDDLSFACKTLDDWIADKNKRAEILAYLDSRDMDSFPNAAYFIRYALLITYIAAISKGSYAYGLFLKVCKTQNLEGYKEKYQLNFDTYKKELIDLIVKVSGSSDNQLFDKLYSDYAASPIQTDELLIKEADILPYIDVEKA